MKTRTTTITTTTIGEAASAVDVITRPDRSGVIIATARGSLSLSWFEVRVMQAALAMHDATIERPAAGNLEA